MENLEIPFDLSKKMVIYKTFLFSVEIVNNTSVIFPNKSRFKR